MGVTALRTQFVVDKCEACPFYQRTAVNVVADWLAKRQAQSGACRLAALSSEAGVLGAFAPLVLIPDATQQPESCPLKRNDVLVTTSRSGS